MGRGQARAQSVARSFAQELLGGAPGWHRIGGQNRGAQADFQRAALRNFESIDQEFGSVGEQLEHFRRRFQVLLLGVAPRTTRREQHAVMNAHPRLVRLEIGARQESDVVAGNRRHAVRAREFHDGLRNDLFARPAGALHLEIKSVAAKRLPALKTALRLIVPAARNRLADIALGAARQNDQSLQRIAADPAAIQHGHTALLAFKIRTGYQLCEIPIALQILAKKHHARRCGVLARFAYPGIDPDQGLDARTLRFLVELHHRKQIALIGQGHRRHARRRDRRHQFRHTHDSIEQRVLGVQSQMHECRHGKPRNARRTGSKERRCKGQGP